MGKGRGPGERTRRGQAREKLRVQNAKHQKREAAFAAALARRREREKNEAPGKKRKRGEPTPMVATPVRPPLSSLIVAILAFVALWAASLVGIFAALQDWSRLCGVLLGADLIAVPLLSFFWCGAAVGSSVRLTPGARAGTFTLAYHMVGRHGGAWLDVVRPRLLLTTSRTRLVMTAFGPRLLPRFVRLEQGSEREIVIDDEMIRLARPAEVEPQVRVAIEAEPEPEPVPARVEEPEASAAPACVECGREVDDDRAICELCVDAVHDGECASRHAERHAGAKGDSVYR